MDVTRSGDLYCLYTKPITFLFLQRKSNRHSLECIISGFPLGYLMEAFHRKTFLHLQRALGTYSFPLLRRSLNSLLFWKNVHNLQWFIPDFG